MYVDLGHHVGFYSYPFYFLNRVNARSQIVECIVTNLLLWNFRSRFYIQPGGDRLQSGFFSFFHHRYLAV